MSALAPWFLAGLVAIGVPIFVHLINRTRKTVVEFPSLMFLQKIPYKSVRRQKLRHLLLLALRCLVLVLLVAAFTRPFLDNRAAGALGAGARERVILLDRSYSMTYGDRWKSALAAARKAISDVGGNDRATIVFFAQDAVASEPTSDRVKLERTIAAAKPSDEATRYGPAIALAARMIEGSNLPRHEVVVISDFQQNGWVRRDDARVPSGTVVTAVDVTQGAAPDMAVAQVTADRDRAGDGYTVDVAARITNTAKDARATDVTLELGGRVVDTKHVSVPAHGAVQVRFVPAGVPSGATRGIVRIPPDAMPVNNTFNLTIAPEDAVSVLVIEPAIPRANQSLFLQRALGIGDRPSFRVDVKRANALTTADLANRALVVLNEVPLPVGAIGARLRELVDNGTGVLLAPGETRADRWPAEWQEVLPTKVGVGVDRTRDAGGALAAVDYGHPIFEIFSAPHSGDFSTAHIFRYRALSVPPGAKASVLARFDDGTPALVEHAVGQGKFVIWASSLDEYWTDLPLQPVFLPFVHELAKHVARYSDARSWLTVGEPLDLSRHGELTAMFTKASKATELVLESPSGKKTILTATGPQHVAELREAGFYELRGATTPVGSGHPIAVDVDLAESDLSHFDPQELVASVTAPSAVSAAGAAAGATSPEDAERRQALWWYLLLAALVCVGAETMVSNRLSSKGSPS